MSQSLGKQGLIQTDISQKVKILILSQSLGKQGLIQTDSTSNMGQNIAVSIPWKTGLNSNLIF